MSDILSTSQLNRSLKRISYLSTFAFKAELELIDGTQLITKIIDLNSTGISLSLDSTEIDKKFIETHVRAIIIWAGRKLLTKISTFEVIRFNKVNNTVVFIFQNSKSSYCARQNIRLKTKEAFTPLLMCKDPVDLRTVLHFRVKDLSINGMKLESSLSNHHIIPGIQLKSAQLVLPGLDVVNVDIQIKYITKINDFLVFGVEFINIKKQLLQKIAQFCLFGTVNQEAANQIQYLQQARFPFRKLIGGVRFSIATTQDELDSVFNVRYQAYKNANKLPSSATIHDLDDGYDARSLVLVAKIGEIVIATIRLILCRNQEDRFPFESVFPDIKIADHLRRSGCEVCRLSVLPEYQNSDLFAAMIGYMVEVAIRNDIPKIFFFSTSRLERFYLNMGAKSVLNKKIPHPVLPNESLKFFLVDASRLVQAKDLISSNWDLIMKNVADNLFHIGFLSKKPSHIFLNLKKMYEFVAEKTKNVKFNWT